MTAWKTTNGLRDRLQANLATFEHREISDSGLRRAAVALVVAGCPKSDGEASIVLTLRPARLKQHSGQYALPGGKVDAGESVVEAALRELDEELGLALDDGAVLGRLDDYPTRSGFCIAPICVWGGAECPLIPAPDEVAEVFHIPFLELDSDAIPVFEPGEAEGAPVLCSEFPTLGHRMYSPTASIIYQFREVGMRGGTTRVAHYDQPQFAWS